MLKQNKINLIILTLTIILILTNLVVAEEINRSPRFSINAVTDDGIIGQAGILYPFRNTKDSIYYTDLRTRIDSDNDISEWNLGFGYRSKVREDLLAGLYIFRDRRNEFDHYWDMWTLGGEILSNNFDLRANAYLADNEKIDNPLGDSVIEAGGRLFYQKSFYSSLNGFDFEVGKRWTETDNIFKNVGVYARFYDFFAEDVEDVRGRELRINKEFGNKEKTNYQLGLMWEDTNQSESSLEATFAVSIPFGASKDSKAENDNIDLLEARMTEAPKRDLNIVVAEADPDRPLNEESAVTALDPLTGEELGNIFYVTKDGSGAGTKTDPTDIETAVNQSAENDIIILLGDQGTITSDSFSLKKGQKLLSPGGYLWTSSDSLGSRKARFEPEGKRAEIEGDSSNIGEAGLIILNDNTAVSGLDLKLTGYGSTIYGEDLTGSVSITNNKIYSETGQLNSEVKVMGSLYSNSLINITGDLNEQESLELNIINNEFSINNAEAVIIEIDGRESYSEVGLVGSSPQGSFGLFKANIKDNIVKRAKDVAFDLNLENLNKNEIIISNNSIESVDRKDELSKAISIFNYAYEQEKTEIEISNNIIKNLSSSYDLAIGVAVLNNLLLSEGSELNISVNNNKISAITSGSNQDIKLRRDSNFADFTENSGIAVINNLDSAAKVTNSIANNQIEDITSMEVRLRFSALSSYPASNENISGIYLYNRGYETEFENNISDNKIDNLTLGSNNKGIYVQNESYSAVNKITANTINNVSSTSSEAAGILITNDVVESVENYIENNKITKIFGVDGRINNEINGIGAILIINEGYDGASARNNIVNNQISGLESNYNFLNGIVMASAYFDNLYTNINDNQIDNIAVNGISNNDFIDGLLIPASAIYYLELDNDSSSLETINNSLENLGNYNPAAGLTLDYYDGFNNADQYKIEANNFSGSEYGILISGEEDQNLREKLESENNFDNDSISINVGFDIRETPTE